MTLVDELLAELELAKRRNLLNPEATAYVDELEGTLEEAQQEVERLRELRDKEHVIYRSMREELAALREALTACIKVLHGCDYATQRVSLGVSGAIHKAAAALALSTGEADDG